MSSLVPKLWHRVCFITTGSRSQHTVAPAPKPLHGSTLHALQQNHAGHVSIHGGAHLEASVTGLNLRVCVGAAAASAIHPFFVVIMFLHTALAQPISRAGDIRLWNINSDDYDQAQSYNNCFSRRIPRLRKKPPFFFVFL